MSDEWRDIKKQKFANEISEDIKDSILQHMEQIEYFADDYINELFETEIENAYHQGYFDCKEKYDANYLMRKERDYARKYSKGKWKLAKKSYVYFIECGHFIKIGKANFPETRLKELQTGNPEKLTLLKTIEFETEEDAFLAESNLHEYYANRRNRFVGGDEWFDGVCKNSIMKMKDEKLIAICKGTIKRNKEA